MLNQYIPVGPNWVGGGAWYRLHHEPLEIDAVAGDEKSLINHDASNPNSANWEDIGFNR
jgi:hypothetical protein